MKATLTRGVPQLHRSHLRFPASFCGARCQHGSGTPTKRRSPTPDAIGLGGAILPGFLLHPVHLWGLAHETITPWQWQPELGAGPVSAAALPPGGDLQCDRRHSRQCSKSECPSIDWWGLRFAECQSVQLPWPGILEHQQQQACSGTISRSLAKAKDLREEGMGARKCLRGREVLCELKAAHALHENHMDRALATDWFRSA